MWPFITHFYNVVHGILKALAADCIVALCQKDIFKNVTSSTAYSFFFHLWWCFLLKTSIKGDSSATLSFACAQILLTVFCPTANCFATSSKRSGKQCFKILLCFNMHFCIIKHKISVISYCSSVFHKCVPLKKCCNVILLYSKCNEYADTYGTSYIILNSWIILCKW